jgi:hypothetical protein
LADELCAHLSKRFHIAVCAREIAQGRGYRLYQVHKPSNRHLVDIHPVSALPPARRIARVLVAAPEELIAQKVIAYHQRRGQPKSGTDWRDLAMLLLTFPALKRAEGPVIDRLRAANADADILNLWNDLVKQKIQPAKDADEF